MPLPTKLVPFVHNSGLRTTLESLPINVIVVPPDARPGDYPPERYSTAFRAMTSLYHSALSFGVRFCVLKST
jgi:hypothetical protein